MKSYSLVSTVIDSRFFFFFFVDVTVAHLEMVKIVLAHSCKLFSFWLMIWLPTSMLDITRKDLIVQNANVHMASPTT